MLVLSRKKNESIVINDDITVVVIELRTDKVRLGVEVPAKDCAVHRREVFDAIHRGQDEPVLRSTTVMIPESGMEALAKIRRQIGKPPKHNGPLIAAILEAVANKDITASDVERFKEKVSSHCPFCEPEADRVWFDNDLGIVLRDAFPLTQGHVLVVPRRHVARIAELSENEQAALWALVMKARTRLDEDIHPDGFNIGVNDGLAAGQTIPHAHIHIIPRREGDVPDPRGGVRWVISEKARYW